jgi:hypothetical protein
LDKKNPMRWRVDGEVFKNNWLLRRPSSLRKLFGVHVFI